MTDAATATPPEEPSIEEILASIRKIISDEPGAEGAPVGDLPLPEAQADNAAAQPADDGDGDEELDLGAFLEEDMTVTDPAPAAANDAGGDWNLDMEDLDDATPPPAVAIAIDNNDDNLVSAPAAAAATAAMARLNQPAPTPKPAGITGGNPLVTAKTIEDVVEDLLRPLLRDWLDQNLPTLVEQLVSKELARMSRRALDD